MLKKSKKKQYPIKMDQVLFDRIKNQAENERRSINALLLVAVEKYLEDQS